ncbi:hypothetical protein Hypma_002076 [Hypsizygus marmoreus]|uniref:Uncharacterized protein n=1 Tax=Hypsizygus marmoreus TaxID=39966 RepID=A0A369KAS6_HYPMA|nr:hypothetical protein Hypma_002076 [Hypsizygus marmoreus]
MSKSPGANGQLRANNSGVKTTESHNHGDRLRHHFQTGTRQELRGPTSIFTARRPPSSTSHLGTLPVQRKARRRRGRITCFMQQEYPQFQDRKHERILQGQLLRRTKSGLNNSAETRDTTTATDYDTTFEQARDTSAASSPHATRHPPSPTSHLGTLRVLCQA